LKYNKFDNKTHYILGINSYMFRHQGAILRGFIKKDYKYNKIPTCFGTKVPFSGGLLKRIISTTFHFIYLEFQRSTKLDIELVKYNTVTAQKVSLQ